MDTQPRAGIRTRMLAAFFAAILLYLCFFSRLSALGFVGPDEPRYANVARAMLESGDWVTPRLNGQPWFEKPALYYWAAAAAFRIFGVNEFAARLPSALAATLATLGLAWLALRLDGRKTAWYVLLLLPTAVGMFGFARAATTDMLFSATLALSLAAAAWALWGAPAEAAGAPSPRYSILAAFGALLGAATLAKGPVAIVLAAGSVGLWALASKRWRDAFRLAHPLAITAFGVVALPWYMLCAARNPGFVRSFLFQHNVERFLTPVFRHEQPVWFFAPILLLGLAPWTVLLYGPARDGVSLCREKRWANSPGLFIACWAIFPVLFFSLSESKLPGYVLPAIPPLILLMARSLARSVAERSALAARLLAGAGVTWVALGLSANHWLKRLPPETGLASIRDASSWVLAAVVGGILVAVLGMARKPVAALFVCVLLTAGMVVAINGYALPRLDAHLSPRRTADALAGMQEPLYGYRLSRSQQYGLDFYLRRELPAWTPETPRPAWVLTSDEGIADFRRMGLQFPEPGARPGQLRLVHLKP